MYFTLKDYQTLKFKNYFKTRSLFLIYHCAKLNLKDWSKTDQKLIKLKLNYYKPLNKVTLKELKNSIYSNYSPIINSSLLFLTINSMYNLTKLNNSLKPLFINVCLKLNNKFYSTQQLDKFQNLSYTKNTLKYYKGSNRFLKLSHLLIRKSK